MAAIEKVKRDRKGTGYRVRWDYYINNPENQYEPLRRYGKKVFDTKEAAEMFQLKIELDKKQNKYIPPSDKTVEAFGNEWLRVYGKKVKWQPATYDGHKRNLEKHIYPVFGNRLVTGVKPKEIDIFFNDLRQKRIDKPQYRNMPESEIPCLSSKSQREIYFTVKLLFASAVTWRLINQSPVTCDAPSKGKPKRVVWDRTMMKQVLENMNDAILHLAIHLAFACTLRIGETVALGLGTEDIDLNTGTIHIHRTLQRVSKEALKELQPEEIYHIFPAKKKNPKSVLVLKKCKTEKSDRFVKLPEPLIAEIKQRTQRIEKEKEFHGSDYNDYGLLLCYDNGNPIEPARMQEMFREWQRESGLKVPFNVFKGLRGSSITMKLKVSNGDIKSVQGDSGHSTAAMVLDTYAETNDYDRNEMFEKFSAAFYGGSESDNGNNETDVSDFVEALKNNPQMRDQLLVALVAQQT